MSDENVTVYGIPNCDTVKKARAWLESRGVAHVFVDFRAHPVGEARVARWVEALGSAALRNTSGQAYRALPDAKTGWSDAEWAKRFAADPMLVKRPVIEVRGEPVMAGFRKADALEAALG
ncbi:MAG: Spx/MgsR family RNA polymerase-binding regulatory protein [Alphaproteobacteria bacterium]|nr:Spx/MgsR family RNA polymerase-binding regulatory protein [Alphaproteobacteria bacterium]